MNEKKYIQLLLSIAKDDLKEWLDEAANFYEFIGWVDLAGFGKVCLRKEYRYIRSERVLSLDLAVVEIYEKYRYRGLFKGLVQILVSLLEERKEYSVFYIENVSDEIDRHLHKYLDANTGWYREVHCQLSETEEQCSYIKSLVN
jgi:hypothetical protein